MRIVEAFPLVFERAYPAIDPKTPMMAALPLLRFHEIDALPLSFDSGRKHGGIFGASCLARIVTLKPKGFSAFLQQPCEEVSGPITTVQAKAALSHLLDIFLETRFGFARVVESKGVGALLSLDDAIGLYDEGVIGSALRAKDVASKAFSLPRNSTLRGTLEAMFARRIRRVFLTGTDDFLWDRGIIEYLFSPAVLAKVSQDPSYDPLETTISDLATIRARRGLPEMTLGEAAGALRVQRGQCLTFGGKVVTPWDLVMKPWKAKKLKIRASR